jgi:fibronectin-binding autotransporter adhesin
MKIRLRILKFLLVLFCTVASTTVFGQVTYTWTGLGDGVNLTNATNYTPNGQPSGTAQDTILWDGLTSSNLLITYGVESLPATGFNTLGINLNLTANQTNSVQIVSKVSVSAGVGVFGVNLADGAGAFTLGDNTTQNIKVFGRPAGATHPFVNNSTNPATINPSVEWQAGGGNGYTYDFSGTGNWFINSFLMPDNASFSPNFVTVEGPGNVYWASGKTGAYAPNSALSTVTINGGALIIKNSGLFTGTANQPIVNNGIFEFDAASQSQTLSGVISGAGSLIVTNGNLTLSGQSTYSGNTILAGGSTFLNTAENAGISGPLGVGGTISFGGGTLGFSVNNVFDYSPRFATTAGQQYKFDTAGQNVTFTDPAGLTSSGGTLAKVGSGTLTLAGPSSYSGSSTVSVGKLVFQGSKTGTGNITVSDSTALGITATGTQVTPAALTLGTAGSTTLEFNNVNSTTTAPLAAGTLASAGTVTINVNSGTLTPGQTYPLLSWTTGTAPAVSLGVLNGFIGTLSTNGNSIRLNVTATAYKWTGLNNGNWDTTTANNWVQNGGPVTFANGGPTLFDDTGATTNIAVNSPVSPSAVSINNNVLSYNITSSGANNIGGSGSLNKIGNSTLVLSGGVNSYTGPTTITGGGLLAGVLANGGAASDIGASSSAATNLVLDGGSLVYTGTGAQIDRLFTLGTSGGTIDDEASGPLVFNSFGSIAYTGNGPRGLTLHGSGTDTNTLAPKIADNGGATSLTKNGTGLWILLGTNTYSGVTTIAQGTLQIGAGGAAGSLGSGSVINNGGLDFNRTGSVTVSGAISGTGAVTNDGTGTVILAGDNTYTGGTRINAGTLQIGNGGGTGKLDPASSIVDNGTLIFNSTGAFTMNGGTTISGTGQLIKRGAGLLKLLSAQTYTGGTTIDAGASVQISQGVAGSFSGTGTITNNGTLIFIRQDNGVFGITNNIIGTGSVVEDVNNPNNGDSTLLGTNTYTGGTVIKGGSIVLGDGLTPFLGTIVGDVSMTNFSTFAGNATVSSLIFNHPAGDDMTFPGNITGQGQVVQEGLNVVTLTGATNTYNGGTIISNGTVRVGAGGAVGSIGTGNVTDSGTLVFNRSGSLSFGGVISGPGAVVQQGPGTLTLTRSNTITGQTTVSNGTLVVSLGVNGDLVVAGGTLGAGGLGTVGSMFVGNGLIMQGGTVAVTLNKSLVQSNSFITANGGVNYTGGTLTLTNAGPSLAVGDKFVIFSAAVANGNTIPIISPGFTVQNDLASDGSVTVLSVTQPKAPTLFKPIISGTNIVLTATNNMGAGGTWTLLATNNLTAPLSTWPVISTGTFDATGSVAITNAIGTGTRFFILRAP